MALYSRWIMAGFILGGMTFFVSGPLLADTPADRSALTTDKSPATQAEKGLQDSAKETPAAEPASTEKLALEQQRIADKYKHFEEVMLELAELERTDRSRPRRLAEKSLGPKQKRTDRHAF